MGQRHLMVRSGHLHLTAPMGRLGLMGHSDQRDHRHPMGPRVQLDLPDHVCHHSPSASLW